jgi:hypothetical protein
MLQSLALEISFNRLQLIASLGRSQNPARSSDERKSNDPVLLEVTAAWRTQHLSQLMNQE